MKITCFGFKPLVRNMTANTVDKVHYAFDYNGKKFDVIFSIIKDGYEVLVGIFTHNWGCALQIDAQYVTDVPNNVYFSLLNILQLKRSTEHFTSCSFLNLLSSHAPKQITRHSVNISTVRKFVPYRTVDEKDKIFFRGWNDHLNDNRIARNFDKTEFFLGKSAADYCRKHNISSIWTDNPKDEIKVIMPWKITHKP